MSGLSMMVMLVVAAVLQAVIPTPAVIGNVRVPVLLGLVIHDALISSRNRALWCAVLAGILQDALCSIPLGYSSFGYSCVVLFVYRYRDQVYVRDMTTHVMFGLIANAALTLMLSIFLAQSELIAIGMGVILRKLVGASLLGAFIVPLVFHLSETLNIQLGLSSPGRIH